MAESTPLRSLGVQALVVRPILVRGEGDPVAALEEAVSLARAVDLCVIDAFSLTVSTPSPATLFGSGQTENVAALVEEKEIALVVVDHALSPIQQRNLEKAWKCKVIDRTGLILEIFGARARTREGKLQVELAALGYQKSRLVRSWTHLERQRGGFGFMGGPGESQLEVDRRQIAVRITKVKEELERVRQTRGLHRRARERARHPTVALVGYTNAGKSTLFNHMTGADVLAKDMLFATLDPTMRGIRLPCGKEAILSDTVGFISDLPTRLVESFRATLEEVQTANVILHVRDVTHPDTRGQKEVVEGILADLGISRDDPRLVEVLNKIDVLEPTERERLAVRSASAADSRAVAVSALTGEGLGALHVLLERRLAGDIVRACISLPLGEGAALAWLYAHAQVEEQVDKRSRRYVSAVFDEDAFRKFNNKFKDVAHVKRER